MIEFEVKPGPYETKGANSEIIRTHQDFGDFLVDREVNAKSLGKEMRDEQNNILDGWAGVPLSLMSADITLDEFWQTMIDHIPAMQDAINRQLKAEGGKYVVFLDKCWWMDIEIPMYQITEIARIGDSELVDLLEL